MAELFIPKNPIEVAQELQRGIDMAHPEVAPQLAQQALDTLGDVRQIYGTNRLIIHSLGAHIFDRGRSMEEIMEASFDELTIRGFFGAISYIQRGVNSHFQSLVVDMYDVTVLSPVIPDDPDRGVIRAPLAIPVQDIQTVLAA